MTTDDVTTYDRLPCRRRTLESLVGVSFIDPAMQESPFAYYRALRDWRSGALRRRPRDVFGVATRRPDDGASGPGRVLSRTWLLQQMAHGHLDAIKDILITKAVGSSRTSRTSIRRGTPGYAVCCHKLSAGGV